MASMMATSRSTRPFEFDRCALNVFPRHPTLLRVSNRIGKSNWATRYHVVSKESSSLFMAKVFYPTITTGEEANLEVKSSSGPTFHDLTKGVLDAAREEAKIFATCSASCEFVVNFTCAWRLKQAYVILMETCPLGSLTAVTKRTTTRGDLLLSMIYCVVQALVHMNELGYFHGDIKPSNLLLSGKGVIQLCDFGSSQTAKRSDQDIPVAKFGFYTEGFKPPETPEAGKCYASDEMIHGDILVGSDQFAKMAMKRDIFALGITIWLLYCGPMDPRPADVDHTNEKALTEILDDCITRDFKSRPVASDLLHYEGMCSVATDDKYKKLIQSYIHKLPTNEESIARDIRNVKYKEYDPEFYSDL